MYTQLSYHIIWLYCIVLYHIPRGAQRGKVQGVRWISRDSARTFFLPQERLSHACARKMQKLPMYACRQVRDAHGHACCIVYSIVVRIH